VELDEARREEVFEAIQQAGLERSAFRWETNSKTQTTFLVHLHSPARFQFPPTVSGIRRARLEAHPRGPYRGVQEVPNGVKSYYREQDWNGIVREVRRWLGLLVEQRGLWDQLVSGGNAPEGDSGTSNARFTPAELAEIARQLGGIAASAQTQYGLSNAEREVLEGTLRYLEEASGSVGRLDWRNLLMGVFLTLMAEALLPPDAMRGILRDLVHGLGHLYAQRMLPELPSGY